MLGLFLGTETFGWNEAQFDQVAQYCVDNQIDQVVLKVYEITQGEWYSSLGGARNAILRFNVKGIDVLPYGYFYGANVKAETDYIKFALRTYEQFCMNLESEFDAHPELATSLATALSGHTGTLYCSTWANPVSHVWAANIDILDPVVDVWMPECYSDQLVKEMYAQFNHVTHGRIEPTFHVSQTNAYMASNSPNFTLWEYRDALQFPNLLKMYVQLDEKKLMTYPTTSKNTVANYLPVSQFQPAHSEFECGAFAVAINQRATAPQLPDNNSTANEIMYAETLYALTAGSNDPSNMLGASVDDMHTMIKNTQSYAPPGLHYWDITSINANSSQEHDIGQIKAALEHGYAVIATVSESSVFDVDLQRNPYWWGPAANHILTYVGIAPDGNLLVADPANVLRGDGNLQTPKQVQQWPRRYDIKSLANQWATIVQYPWLPPIPNNDPMSWPMWTPPSTPPPVNDTLHNLTVVYDLTVKEIRFMDGVTVVYRISL